MIPGLHRDRIPTRMLRDEVRKAREKNIQQFFKPLERIVKRLKKSPSLNSSSYSNSSLSQNPSSSSEFVSFSR